jgi:hypothetical protein
MPRELPAPIAASPQSNPPGAERLVEDGSSPLAELRVGDVPACPTPQRRVLASAVSETGPPLGEHSRCMPSLRIRSAVSQTGVTVPQTRFSA